MFKVRWKLSALNELTTLWTTSDSALREAITVATNCIDEELKHAPTSKGESREADKRILFVFPLGVLFTVDGERHLVRVIRVWSYKRRR